MPGGKHILGKSKAKRVFGTARVGDRGQIVIPKEARELFGIRPGDTLLLLGDTVVIDHGCGLKTYISGLGAI